MSEHFTFALTTTDGREVELPIKCGTSLGVMLLCPGDMPRAKIEHLLDLARKAPGNPIDLTHFKGEGDEQKLVWSARVRYYGAAQSIVLDHWKCVCNAYMHHRLNACLTCGRMRFTGEVAT